MKNLLSPKKNFVKSTRYLVFSLVKMLISRNFCQKSVTVNLRHSVEICKFFPHDILQKFRQINFFTKELLPVNQFDEKILQWGKISEITTLCSSVLSQSILFDLTDLD